MLRKPPKHSPNSLRSLIHSKYNRNKITPAHTVIGCSVKPNNIFGYSGECLLLLTHPIPSLPLNFLCHHYTLSNLNCGVRVELISPSVHPRPLSATCDARNTNWDRFCLHTMLYPSFQNKLRRRSLVRETHVGLLRRPAPLWRDASAKES